MHELFLLIAMMVVILLVMIGLAGLFRRWMDMRENLRGAAAGDPPAAPET